MTSRDKRHIKALHRIANGGWLPTDGLWAGDNRGVAYSSRATVWKSGAYALDRNGETITGNIADLK